VSVHQIVPVRIAWLGDTYYLGAVRELRRKTRIRRTPAAGADNNQGNW
jgi:hypothetical protein